MKCKHCDCCRKGFFKSQPDKYVCIGVKEPFVITDINRDCTEYKDIAENNKTEVVRCPHCDESYYQELYSITTCVYSPNIYKNGELISKSAGTINKVCRCLNCLKEFSYTSKE